VEVAGQMKSLFQDGDQQINADGDPDLGFDDIGRCAVKGFDSEMLLDTASRDESSGMSHIPQAFPVCKLGIGKAEKLIITGKFSDPVIALVFFDAFVKLITWQMLQYLCKNGFPDIHRQPSLPLLGRRYRPECAM